MPSQHSGAGVSKLTVVISLLVFRALEDAITKCPSVERARRQAVNRQGEDGQVVVDGTPGAATVGGLRDAEPSNRVKGGRRLRIDGQASYTTVDAGTAPRCSRVRTFEDSAARAARVEGRRRLRVDGQGEDTRVRQAGVDGAPRGRRVDALAASIVVSAGVQRSRGLWRNRQGADTTHGRSRA